MSDDRYDRVVFRGHTVNKWTRAALLACEAELGYQLTIMQGSYRPKTSYSGTTHVGGGAVDLAPYDWKRKQYVAANHGFAAYHRLPLPGVWGEHIHLELLDDADASDSAKAQWADWRANPPRDGLVGGHRYAGYRPKIIKAFPYPPPKEAPVVVETRITVVRDLLSEALAKASEAAVHNTGGRRLRIVAAERSIRAVLAALPKK